MKSEAAFFLTSSVRTSAWFKQTDLFVPKSLILVLKRFGYKEHSLTMNNLICIFLRIVSGVQCKERWPPLNKSLTLERISSVIFEISEIDEFLSCRPGI